MAKQKKTNTVNLTMSEGSFRLNLQITTRTLVIVISIIAALGGSPTALALLDQLLR